MIVNSEEEGRREPGELCRNIVTMHTTANLWHDLGVESDPSHPNHSDNIRWSFDVRYNPTGQPTGRGFIARSRKNSATELRDPTAWARLWQAARHMLATEGMGRFNSWSADRPACA
jgi:hypothetical protein